MTKGRGKMVLEVKRKSAAVEIQICSEEGARGTIRASPQPSSSSTTEYIHRFQRDSFFTPSSINLCCASFELVSPTLLYGYTHVVRCCDFAVYKQPR